MKKLTALLLAIAMMVTCTLCAVAEDGKTYNGCLHRVRA